MDLENGQEAFDLMSDVTDFDNNSETTTETQETTQEQPTQGQPAEQTATSQPSEVDGLKQTVNDLQRLIASHPDLRAQYAREKYGDAETPFLFQQEMPQHTQQYADPQQFNQQGQQGLPFDPQEYDWTSYEHQAALIGNIVQQQLQPFAQYIGNAQQQEQKQVQQQAYQQVQKIDTGINDQFEKVLPGYSEWFAQDTPDSGLLGKFISDAFQKTLMELHPPTGRDRHGNPVNPYWYHEKVHAEVVSKLAPQIKGLASKLGFQIKAPNTATTKTKAREFYTEGSNAIPASGGGNSFDKAFDSGDMADAMATLVSK